MAETILHRDAVNHDRTYQALRLRGLAGLLRASGEHLQDLTNLPETMLYLSSTLDEIADTLDGGD
jgi:hypothetical protein